MKKELPIISSEIDKLVYYLGRINLKPFKGLKEEYFQADLDVNVFGAIKVLQNYAKNLQVSEEVSVVSLSTVAVKMGVVAKLEACY